MISAATQSTADLTPGRRYVLALVNGSAGTVGPIWTDTTGSVGVPVVPENSTTAFTVAAGATKWLEFVAWTNGLILDSADPAIYWTVTPVLP